MKIVVEQKINKIIKVADKIIAQVAPGVKVITGGRQGLAGPKGEAARPGYQFFMLAGQNITIPLYSAAPFAFTIDKVNKAVVQSGSTVLTIRINGVAVTGLTNMSIGMSPQDFTATANNVVNEGDSVDLVIVDAGSSRIEFTMDGDLND